MCIICFSPEGTKQPDHKMLQAMFNRNPNGAGYMVARNGSVQLHKGFMSCEELIAAVDAQHFTENDVTAYHFRIATQAGVNKPMCHPFPLSPDPRMITSLDVNCQLGVMHNGVIPLTSNGDKYFSDTALFVADYLTQLIREADDLFDPSVYDLIEQLIGNSRMLLLHGSGEYLTIGKWYPYKGLLFSNPYCFPL